MDNQYEETLHNSIKDCLRETFKCNFVKDECIVAFEEIEWKGYNIDVVGYSEDTKSLYIVEAKNVTWLGSSGIASAIGQIIVDMAAFREKDTMGCIRKYVGINDREVKNIYFYIALPNFQGDELYKKNYPLALQVLKEVYRILSGKLGLLEIHDLNKSANIVTGLEAKPIVWEEGQ